MNEMRPSHSLLGKLLKFLDQSTPDQILTGIVGNKSANLTHTISAGTAFVNGFPIDVAAAAHTYNASKDTYVDLKADGTFDFSNEVANNAAEPPVTANSLRILRVITSGSAIAFVQRLILVKKVSHFLNEPVVSGEMDGNGYTYFVTGSGLVDRMDGPDQARGMWLIIAGSGSASTIVVASSDFGTGTTSLFGINLRQSPIRCATVVKFALNAGLTNKDEFVGYAGTKILSSLIAAGTGKGCFFRISAAGSAANIFAVTKNGAGASETVTDLGITEYESMQKRFGIVATLTSVKFYIDDVLVATHTTNIPDGTNDLSFIVGLRTTAANNVNMAIDYIEEEIPVFAFI